MFLQWFRDLVLPLFGPFTIVFITSTNALKKLKIVEICCIDLEPEFLFVAPEFRFTQTQF